MKIVFFGTSNVALPVLEVLNQHHQVVGVVTQPDAEVGRKRELTESPISVLAGEMGLQIFKPETVKDNNFLRLELRDLAADIFIVVSYGKILPAEIINLPKYKTLNVHFSLLPKYRGASPIQAAILNGETETGTSIMILDEQLDHGPILTAEKFPIDNDDNYITLSTKLAHTSARLLLTCLPDYVDGKLKPTPQDESQASYTQIISKEDGRVNWSQPAGHIYNMFRAYYGWPGIWTIWKGKVLKILTCNVSPANEAGPIPGTVLEGGFIACGENTKLAITSLQLEGKTQTTIDSFLNGYKDFVGSKLE